MERINTRSVLWGVMANRLCCLPQHPKSVTVFLADVKSTHCSSFSSAVFALSIRWWVTSSWWVVISDFHMMLYWLFVGGLFFCFWGDVWQFYCISWGVLSRNKSLHFSHLHIMQVPVCILALHKGGRVQFCLRGMFVKCEVINFRKLLKINV